MVFCNNGITYKEKSTIKVTILILIDGFLQLFEIIVFKQTKKVTILILIDGFLQFNTFSYIRGVLASQSLF